MQIKTVLSLKLDGIVFFVTILGTYPSNTCTSDADVVCVSDVPEYIPVDNPEGMTCLCD